MDMNNVTLIGRLTKDPELRQTPNGKNVCSFGLACNGRGEDDTSFFDVEVWGRTGEIVNDYQRKGSRVCVSGSLRQERWTAKDGTNRSRVKIVAFQVQFLDPKSDGNGNQSQGNRGRSGGAARGSQQDYGTHEPVDEPPF